MNVFEFGFESINGNSMPLSNWQGQPILLVNTASESEFTPQFQQLQRIWMDYRQSGLIVIAIPCDDFGHEEPGDEESIAEFCKTKYQVSFPMTVKYRMTGISAHPIVHTIREEFGEDAVPRWNFYKYFFDRTGQMLNFWPSKVSPADDLITHQVERNLQSWIF